MPVARLNKYSDFVQGVGFAGETAWTLSKSGLVTVYSLDSEGKPSEERKFELITPGAFKLSAARNRVVISTSSNDLYTYPASARGVARLARDTFPPDRIKMYEKLPDTKARNNVADKEFVDIQAKVTCSYQPEIAERLLDNLTSIARDRPSIDIDAKVWNDLCFFGSFAAIKPSPSLMAACYAAVSTNPSDWNFRSSLAFALARNGDREAALQEYRIASLYRGFRSSEEIKTAFVALESDRTSGRTAFQGEHFEKFLKTYRGNNPSCADPQ